MSWFSSYTAAPAVNTGTEYITRWYYPYAPYGNGVYQRAAERVTTEWRGLTAAAAEAHADSLATTYNAYIDSGLATVTKTATGGGGYNVTLILDSWS
mgnify:FL=1